MNTTEQALEEKKVEVLVDNNAQSIFDHLNELVNLGGDQKKRWIWELLQNAKDSVSEEQNVTIEIELLKDVLIFKHNGNLFTDDEIIHLIYHGSTKKGLEEKTGKFGTGFLTTHLLSKKVFVSGFMDDGNYFRFTLDRSGADANEIRTAMETSWQEFKSSKKPHNLFPDNRFTTQFKYPLNSEGFETVKKGLSDLKNLLPYVLAFNIKLESIILKSPAGTYSFKKISQELFDENGVHIVSIEYKHPQAETRLLRIALTNQNHTSVAIQIDKTSENCFRVKEVSNSLPRLFYDFPLLGTEDFSFPAIINSSIFKPKTERDGIYLGAEDTDDVKINKQIINSACNLFQLIIKSASEKQWQNLYVMSYVGKSGDMKWLDSDWYNQLLIKSMLENILETQVVVTESGLRIVPKGAYFPIGGVAEDLWELMFKIYPNKLPAKKDLSNWTKALTLWAELRDTPIEKFPFAISLKKLAVQVSEFHNINALNARLLNEQAGQEDKAIGWLNKFLRLIISQDHRGLLEDYELLPNQNGKFQKRSGDFYFDQNIEEALKDISKLIDVDWREKLLDKRISIDENLLTLPPKNQEEVLTQTISKIKQLADTQYESEQFKKASILLFKWLVDHKRFEHLKDFPVFCRKIDEENKEIIVPLSEHQKLLGPIDIWKKPFDDYVEIFPQDFILSSDYHEQMTYEDWCELEKASLTISNPLYSDKQELARDELELLLATGRKLDIEIEQDEEKDHISQNVLVSKIAFLGLKDKGIIDTVRKSKSRSILFIDFLLTCITTYDNKWLESVNVNCSCGSSHNIFPAYWLYRLKNRQWVFCGRGKQEIPTSVNLAPFFEENSELISKLKQDKPARLLNRLEVSVGDLLRNIVAKDDDEARFEWDKTFGALLTSTLDPKDIKEIISDAEFISQYEEQKRNRQRIERNQQIGAEVERIFQTLFEKDIYKGMGFKITRTGYGSDYEIEHDFIHDKQEQLLNIESQSSKWLIELKSSNKPHVTMTSLQGQTAVENSKSFALCVVPLSGSEITPDYIKLNARFVTDIGDLLNDKVRNVQALQQMSRETTAITGNIEIDMVDAQIRYRVKEPIWKNGKSFDEFLSIILGKPSTEFESSQH